MKDRAWMEAEREIIQNQNLIFKPDSVFEYTCFDNLVERTWTNAAPLFSDSFFRGAAPLMPMDQALTNIVMLDTQGYLVENFFHRFLGDRMLDTQLSPFSNSTPFGQACDAMAKVWKTAKCWNFVQDGFADTDDFFSLSEYRTRPDNRKYPLAMQRCDGPGADIWEQRHLRAINADSFDVPANDLGQGYPFRDPLEIYFVDLIRPKLVPGECTDPVLTGITVRLSPGGGADKYPDGICTNPGCSYDGEAEACGGGGGGADPQGGGGDSGGGLLGAATDALGLNSGGDGGLLGSVTGALTGGGNTGTGGGFFDSVVDAATGTIGDAAGNLVGGGLVGTLVDKAVDAGVGAATNAATGFITDATGLSANVVGNVVNGNIDGAINAGINAGVNAATGLVADATGLDPTAVGSVLNGDINGIVDAGVNAAIQTGVNAIGGGTAGNVAGNIANFVATGNTGALTDAFISGATQYGAQTLSDQFGIPSNLLNTVLSGNSDAILNTGLTAATQYGTQALANQLGVQPNLVNAVLSGNSGAILNTGLGAAANYATQATGGLVNGGTTGALLNFLTTGDAGALQNNVVNNIGNVATKTVGNYLNGYVGDGLANLSAELIVNGAGNVLQNGQVNSGLLSNLLNQAAGQTINQQGGTVAQGIANNVVETGANTLYNFLGVRPSDTAVDFLKVIAGNQTQQFLKNTGTQSVLQNVYSTAATPVIGQVLQTGTIDQGTITNAAKQVIVNQVQPQISNATDLAVRNAADQMAGNILRNNNAQLLQQLDTIDSDPATRAEVEALIRSFSSDSGQVFTDTLAAP